MGFYDNSQIKEEPNLYRYSFLTAGLHVRGGQGRGGRPGPGARRAGHPGAGQVPRHHLLPQDGGQRLHAGEVRLKSIMTNCYKVNVLPKVPIPGRRLALPGQHGGLHQEDHHARHGQLSGTHQVQSIVGHL